MRIDNGIEIITTNVERQEPRNRMIIIAVSTAAMAPSFEQPHDRFLDEHRLVEQFLDHHAGRRRCARGDQRVLDRVDDGERRGVAVLDDAEQDRAAAVGSHHVLLHGVAVMHLTDVLDEDGGAVGELDRDVVEIVDRGRHRVGADGVLGVADLGGSPTAPSGSGR